MKSLVFTAAILSLFPGSCQLAGDGSRIALPEPVLRGLPVEEAIALRRSVRSYSGDSLSLGELSQLLFAAQGITGRSGEKALRSAPSAGATYPIEVYAFVNRVRGLLPGIYHYIPQGHMVEIAKGGTYGDSLAHACFGQPMPGDAAVSLVLTAVPERTVAKYGARGLRYIEMEAGHIGQNICLQSTSLGLGAVNIGAFDDARVNRLLGLDGEHETALYVTAIGRPATKRGEIE